MMQLAFGAMTDVVHFLMEIDKLKLIERRTKIIGHGRPENSANIAGILRLRQ